MSNEQKNNSGAIFKNDKKTSDNQPDYKGKIVVDNVEKQIALWLKTSKAGTKYFSVAISDVKEYAPQTEQPAPAIEHKEFLQSDLPF
jgi:uncharacterized protein (DUF736 family)